MVQSITSFNGFEKNGLIITLIWEVQDTINNHKNGATSISFLFATLYMSLIPAIPVSLDLVVLNLDQVQNFLEFIALFTFVSILFMITNNVFNHTFQK